MEALPNQLVSGKQSRLFSSLKLSNKELIATSTLLAVFRLAQMKRNNTQNSVASRM